jgi:hypothetical protein
MSPRDEATYREEFAWYLITQPGWDNKEIFDMQ